MQGVDIMLYIKEELNRVQQKAIELKIRENKGVIASRFNKKQLLVIYYNAEMTSSLSLLKNIKVMGYEARLIGM